MNLDLRLNNFPQTLKVHKSRTLIKYLKEENVNLKGQSLRMQDHCCFPKPIQVFFYSYFPLEIYKKYCG
jgi:hypothetical protein